MKLVKFGAILTLIAIVVIFIANIYYGSFKSIDLKEVNAGGDIVVYEEARGSYTKSGEIMDKIYLKLLNEENIKSTKGIGIYYDDPKYVPVQDLRFEAGKIIENVGNKKLEELKKKYKIKTIPEGKYMVAEFPYKGLPSIVIGIKKAYTKFNEYVEQNNLVITEPSIEIYDIANKKIIYMLKI